MSDGGDELRRGTEGARARRAGALGRRGALGLEGRTGGGRKGNEELTERGRGD